MVYTGTDTDILALSAADLAIIVANWPHQGGITQTQYNVWLEASYAQWLMYTDDILNGDLFG